MFKNILLTIGNRVCATIASMPNIVLYLEVGKKVSFHPIVFCSSGNLTKCHVSFFSRQFISSFIAIFHSVDWFEFNASSYDFVSTKSA